MQNTSFALVAMCLILFSCTKDKTDYEAVMDELIPAIGGYQETAAIPFSSYTLLLEAPDGQFQTGYNKLRLQVIDQQSKQALPLGEVDEITITPILTDENNQRRSGPHQRQIDLNDQGLYTGYIVFPESTDANKQWELYLTIHLGDSTYHIQDRIEVHERRNPNLNMTTFIGNDGATYHLALLAPEQPEVGENKLIASVHRQEHPFHYTVPNNYTLLLDPRMPEPSMGNHTSPNNQDLRQQHDGHYQGVVNYTMTGNWTLNFILLDVEGTVIKGTKVPTDFTPGIPGVKSELHLDILF